MIKRLLSILICIIITLTAVGCGGKNEPKDTNADPDSQLEQPVNSEAGWRRTIIYYASDEGFIVPVMKLIPWEEGIGKAALKCLVGTEANISATSVMGLNTVVPEGVTFELSINEKEHGRVNLLNLPKLSDQSAEIRMITAIINTLTEFPTIQTVSITVNGKGGKLPHGTPLPENSGRISLNPENADLATSTSETVHPYTLYYTNQSANLNVPVTVYSTESMTFYDAAASLVDGPKLSGLRSCFPEGTRLIDASVTDNTATVNLSGSFSDISYSPGLDVAAYETLFLTACGFGNVSELIILVDGTEYEFSSGSVSAPLYANEF